MATHDLPPFGIAGNTLRGAGRPGRQSRLRRFFAGMLAGATLLSATLVIAEDSRINLEQPTYSFLPDAPTEVSPGLWKRFQFSFNAQANDLFADRFHPFNLLHPREDEAIRSFGNYYENATDIARRTFSDSITTSLRDSVLDLNLPIVTWLEDRGDFLASVLFNSIDSVAEESVSPLDVSYGRIEQSWWNEVSQSGRVRVGLRPFNTDPYAFMSWSLRSGGDVLLLGHVRYRFRDFSDHSFELGFSLPISTGLSLDMGTSYQFGRHDDEKRVVLKLSKVFKSGGLIHIGLEAQKNPVLIAGISFPW